MPPVDHPFNGSPPKGSSSQEESKDKISMVANVSDLQKNQEQKSEKKNRCFKCGKKLGLLGLECKCQKIFCNKHRYAEEHNCPYDYKAEGKKKIQEQNPQIIADKIKKI